MQDSAKKWIFKTNALSGKKPAKTKTKPKKPTKTKPPLSKDRKYGPSNHCKTTNFISDIKEQGEEMEILAFDNWRGNVMTSESSEWHELCFMAVYATKSSPEYQQNSLMTVQWGGECEMTSGISLWKLHPWIDVNKNKF